MSQSTLSRRLSGSSPFKIDELAAIAALLGIRVSSFFVQLPCRASGALGTAAPASVSSRIPARAPRPAHRGPTASASAVLAAPNPNPNPTRRNQIQNQTRNATALGRRSA